MNLVISYKATRMASTLFLLIAMLSLTACNKQTDKPAIPDASSPLTIHVALSTNVIHIGDRFSAIVTLGHPADTEIVIPLPEDGKNIVLLDREQNGKDLNEAFSQTVFEYQLTSFRPGSHLLWTQQIQCVSSEGKKEFKDLPDTRIEVSSVITKDNEQLRGIKGPVNWEQKKTWRMLVVLLIVVLIIFVLIYLVLHRRARAETPAVPPPVPPHILALRALDALLEKGYIKSSRIEEFYVELSSIARDYLENRFNLRAPEQTTEEFIHEAVNSHLLSQEHQQTLREFLEQSDLVKFARHAPEENDMQAAFDAAKHFVIDTQPGHPEEVSS